MIYEPRKTTEVAGHGDIRDGVFIECDTQQEIEFVLGFLRFWVKSLGQTPQ